MKRMGAVLAAAALVAVTATSAVAEVEGRLPGGIGIAVDIELPLPGTVVPKGTVTVTGTASVGTTASTPQLSLVYVLDSSGSLSQAGWDEEKKAVADFHRKVAQQPYLGVASVGLAAFSTGAATVDVGSAPGKQLLTAPGGDEFLTALAALPWQNGSTNFIAGLEAGTEIANATTTPRTIMIFLSDGRHNTGGNVDDAVSAVPERVDIYAAAFGPDGTCNGHMEAMTYRTGGTCLQTEDAAGALEAMLAQFPSELNHLTLTVDGGPELPITDITPALPKPGPQAVTYSVETPPLDVGTHPLCVTAHGSDFGGPGTVTDCTHVIILEPAPPTSSSPPPSTPPTASSSAPLPPGLPGNDQVRVIPRGGVATGDGTFGR